MTTIQLEYIVALDTYRHFSTAAEKCCVTQPTLSMQIQKLEDDLGVKIFDRSKQPVIPTEIGEEIIAQARNVLKEAQKIKEIITDKKNEIVGEIKLGVIPTLAPYILPLFLNGFITKFPQIKLKIFEFTTEVLIDKLKNNLLDVGLLVTPLHDDSLFENRLFLEEFVVYLSKSHELVNKKYVLPNEIDVNRLWLLEEGHCIRSQIIKLCELKTQQKENQRFEYETGSIETLKKMVEINNGLTILPELALNDLSPQQLLYVRKFSNPVPVREVGLVTHRNFIKRKLIEALKNEIILSVPDKMKEREGKLVIEL